MSNPSLSSSGRGKANRVGIALARLRLDRGSPRLRQSQKPGDLVEGLSRRVVDGAAKTREFVPVIDTEDLAMPARHQQQKVGKPRAVRQARRQGVTGQVIDPDQGFAKPQRQPLGRHDAGQNPADQPRPRRDGDRIDGPKRDTGRLQRGLHRAVQALGMGAGGDLRDDAAILGMKLRLADHDRRQDLRRLARSVQHRSGGIVATRFQSEDEEVLAQGWLSGALSGGFRAGNTPPDD
jgi:hypothetical protein